MHAVLSPNRLFLAKDIMETIILPSKSNRVQFYYSDDEHKILAIKFLSEKAPDSFKLYFAFTDKQRMLKRAYLAPAKFLAFMNKPAGKYFLMHLDDNFYALLPSDSTINPNKLNFKRYVKTKYSVESMDLYFRVLPTSRFVLSSMFRFVENKYKVILGESELNLDVYNGSVVSSINKTRPGKHSKQLMGRVPKLTLLKPGKYNLEKVTETKYRVVSIDG